MGQALRRAAAKVRFSGFDPPPPPSKPQNIKRIEIRAPSRTDRPGDFTGPDNFPQIRNNTSVLDEWDPEYDAMLREMVGRISTKPGGKLEMGEAVIVEKYSRPLPKQRSMKDEVNRNEQKPPPPGTLDVAQLKQIILLHQGKSEEHQGPMHVDDIAKKFNIDVVHVQKILQFVSLPPEVGNKAIQQ